ncbi:MAG: type I restriction-modification system subunit M [Acidobacteriia bacterium]|nr:type I restriction-modification system subunit M [Terriglobia bacterium]
MNGFTDKVAFIWSVADLLRGPYKPHQYGRVILPLTVLRRLDCVLEPTKQKVLDRHAVLKSGPVKDFEPILNRVAGHAFHNISKMDFQKLKGDPDKIAPNLDKYIKSFSSKARQIFEFFEFDKEIAKLDESDRLYQVVKKFADIDLHPDKVPNHEMGLIFEDLIRRFNESSNETAGDHFTPREVIRLMVNLLFEPDGAVLRKAGIVRTLYDPACGTGGMLSVSEEYLRDLNPQAQLEVFGQDYNNEAFAICCSDMMIKGQNPENIKFGDSFTKDGLPGMKFDYLLANPPFGVEWKPQADAIEKEHEEKGFEGRFGAGLPRINDGSFLFIQHMISKTKPSGSRLAIVFNGSPLFTGDAGSGESDIRKWIIENDWLEAIVALPDQMFYNTGISTYIWILTNRKRPERRGKVQLINAVDLFQKMRRSLGNKRNELSDAHIADITRIYGEFKESEQSKIFDNDDFGYRQITVERPLRLRFQVTQERIEWLKEQTAFQNLARSRKKGKEGQREIEAGEALQAEIIAMLKGMNQAVVDKSRPAFEKRLTRAAQSADIRLSAALQKAILTAMSERNDEAQICVDADGNPEPDSELRDYENVPLKENIHLYFNKEVKPHVRDAWIEESKTRIGYEIPFTRHFYKYTPPRPLEEIRAEIKRVEHELVKALAEVMG